MPIFDRIEIDPRVCNGKAVIQGTRIPVSVIMVVGTPLTFELEKGCTAHGSGCTEKIKNDARHKLEKGSAYTACFA